ncbi:RNA polymerase sigma-70 factor, ECF subfamily [Granulicella pectinivorans]|jgi:RNA polymerase sigma-70 factor (ECF subfamily)|uniref:RNA polymerase sigma factor n=1 Tax=Granulicella pectinivorans TaxID=474950 RepID=A0A1I6LWP0_9BACT|nr:sigma-70 family RNA polymerase sigma factor [Granulicella pectinivorans]SFS07891.1 RNA polymerase sigma-70 factor, ECF subfamily [Granulicella pectinivorans]
MALAIGEFSLGWFGREETQDQPDIAGLVRDFNGLLYRVAYSVVRNPSEAEDVVQETFLRVIEHRGKLAGIREMKPWLVRICWNLALDRKRRIRPDQMDDAAAAELVSRDLGAEAQIAIARDVAMVLKALDKLPAAEKACLLLCAVEELTTAEVAVVLGKSESSVRSLIFRARTHLKQRLGGAI